jgi:hypothetical protein
MCMTRDDVVWWIVYISCIYCTMLCGLCVLIYKYSSIYVNHYKKENQKLLLELCKCVCIVVEKDKQILHSIITQAKLETNILEVRDAILKYELYKTTKGIHFTHIIHFSACSVCLSDKYTDNFIVSTCCFKTMHQECFNAWKDTLNAKHTSITCTQCNTKVIA